MKFKIGMQVKNKSRPWFMEIQSIDECKKTIRFIYFHGEPITENKRFIVQNQLANNLDFIYTFENVERFIREGSWEVVKNKVDFELIRLLYE